MALETRRDGGEPGVALTAEAVFGLLALRPVKHGRALTSVTHNHPRMNESQSTSSNATALTCSATLPLSLENHACFHYGRQMAVKSR